MTSEQWEEVKDRFHEALAQNADKRQEFLIRACSSELVRLEVERLLEYKGAGGLLSRPLMLRPATSSEELFDDREEFHGTPRFHIHERLGAGTFGIVYRAFDRERNSFVALKTLRQLDAPHLARFKREFRSLVDLTHPNLVQLYELFGEDHQWFFTMELVEGVDFISYVRPSNGPCNLERLRNALFQLAIGVQALHSSARLHRDLKPSNVHVKANGEVVILDFGLVKEFESGSIEQSLGLAGSPAYMAPEQVAGGFLNEEADWYAVGVMLYKALTGQLPFAGAWTEILDRKQREQAPAIRDVVPDAPGDLDEACGHLLQRSPELRLKGVAILLAQGQRSVTKAARSEENFVGRVRELNLLRERFAALSSGKRQVVLLEGRSGIGKTSLVSHFLTRLTQEHPGTVILKGRCRESEVVPFKAIDPIADELVRYLQSLEGSVAAALLPRRPELLKRLFPVFGELPVFSTFPDRPARDLAEQDNRRRAFEAFCELLGRMTDRSAVVISIDDLQWGGDLDSLALLGELVIPSNAPPLMLILAFRSEEADSSAPVIILRAFREKLKDPESWLDVHVDGLSEHESRELLHLLEAEENSITEEQSGEILRESGGSPLVLTELLRFTSREIGAGETDKPPVSGLLSEMIRHRARKLPPSARYLLEALTVSGEPVWKSMLYRIGKVSGEDPARGTGVLIREHLARFTGGPQGEYLEPFHDQVREAALAWLSPEELREWHSRLAESLEAEEEVDRRRLLRHYQGAGNLAAAFQAALAAAEISERALAFEQAGRLYTEALETGEADEATEASLHQKRAEALAKAGRGYESAQSYLEAARRPAYNNVIEMRRLAAEQLMRSGYLDEGFQIFVDLLRSSGIRMPATRAGTLLSMLTIRLLIRLHGLRWRERLETEFPPGAFSILDLLWSGATALVLVDTTSGSYLQALHMLTALRVGEPSRVALSLAFSAFYESVGGPREYEHGRKRINLSQEVAERLSDPYPAAFTYGSWAGIDCISGRVEDGLSHCRIAIASLQVGSRRSRAWDLDTSNVMLVWFLGWGGRIRQLSHELPVLLQEGRSRGDVYAEVILRCFTTAHLVDLAADDAEGGIAEIEGAIKKWRKSQYDVQHFGATFARMECLFYSGRTEEARKLLVSDWRAIRRSLLFRKVQVFRVILFYARGRTALAEWLRCPEAEELRLETKKYADWVSKQRSSWGAALGNLLRAGLMAGSGRRTDALRLLKSAEELLRKQDLRLLAAAALRRCGELEGESGADRVESADAFMKAENILRPDRMTAMILPGDWGSGASRAGST